MRAETSHQRTDKATGPADARATIGLLPAMREMRARICNLLFIGPVIDISRKLLRRLGSPFRQVERPAPPYSVFVSTAALPSHAVQTAPARTESSLDESASLPLRILLILPANPYPPVAGAYMRWWAIVRYLGQRHNLTLAMFRSPYTMSVRNSS